MNERIQQLAEQAKQYMTEQVTFFFLERNKELTYNETANIFEQKFAELIVEECISQARTQMHNDDEIASEEDPLMLKLSLASNFGVESAVEAIQKHFGVEE
jgi:hypothetical protein